LAHWQRYNPILGNGELGLVTDTSRIKVGDGVKDWDLAPYISDSINPIINGNFRIDQLAETGAAVTTTTVYFCDQWASLGANSGATCTAGVVTASGQSSGYLTVTGKSALAGNEYGHGFVQMLEYGSALLFSNRYFVLSFDFVSNVIGTYSVVLMTGDQTYSYVTDFTYSASGETQDVKKTIFIPYDKVIAGTYNRGFFVIIGRVAVGTYATATLDQWVSGNLGSSTSAVDWENGAGTPQIKISNVYAGVDSIPPAFPYRSYADELRLCQRYATRIFSNYSNVGSGHCSTTTNGRVLVPLPVQLRLQPSLALSSAVSNWRIVSNGAAFTPSAIAAVGYDPLNGVIINSTISGATASQNATLLAATSSEYINFTARM
jgi:hypothetical protein